MGKLIRNYLAVVSCIVFLAAGVSAQQGRGLLTRAEAITSDRFEVMTTTTKGVSIVAVKAPSRKMLDAIDKGFSDLFAVARRNGYKKLLKYSDYTVFIAKPDRQKNADGNYSPDIAVGSAQYAGTEYDKGGYIYVAGMVVNNSPAAFVIGEHTKDFGRASDVVRFEGEHLVLYHNDRRRYNETADHSRGGGHPILQ